jgi:hypothetical protein
VLVGAQVEPESVESQIKPAPAANKLVPSAEEAMAAHKLLGALVAAQDSPKLVEV